MSLAVVVLRKEEAACVGVWTYFFSGDGSGVAFLLSCDHHRPTDLMKPSGEQLDLLDPLSSLSRGITW